MFKCRECKISCHRKCFSKLVDEDIDVTVAQDTIPATEAPDSIPETEASDIIPATAIYQQQAVPLQQIGIPSIEPINGYQIAIFLQQKVWMFLDYSELVARVRAAKYAQRSHPVLNFTDWKYIVWGQEIHLVTKFEMDDGDEYYVVTICYDRRCNENRYIGETLFVYSPSILHETVRVLNRLWNRPHLVRIQSVTDRDYP